ncbi:MAG TPA: pantoate--beta-alanine ligase [Balneolaceae bacterium]|nr:pantoate--beta-alanine ligase [Balneolaceae bacterium]
MIICRTIREVREAVASEKSSDKTVSLVPTMGALHEGHLSLIETAKRESDAVVVSIFVNPTQFAPHEDFDTYPRNEAEDIKKCREAGVSIVFIPAPDEIYDEKNYYSIQIDQLNEHMDGKSRPGFFEGIVQVVNKFFNIIEPDIAVFGQKDIQQYLILTQMVKEFNHPIRLISSPTVRAPDGLALSSRNAYLSREERVLAPSLYRALLYIEKNIRGGVHTPKMLISHQWSELEAKGFKVDYLGVYSVRTLQPVETVMEESQYTIAGAVYLGKTRLIDNLMLKL